MEQKTKGISKKNIYLILLSLAIVAVVIAITIALASSSSEQIETGKSSGKSTQTSTVKSTSTQTGDGSSQKEPTSNDTTQTTAPIVFVNPVSGGYLLTEYTQASVVYNQTLGIYTGHMGADIAGEENAKVFAVYDGEIESITTSYLTGTTVTISHGNDLKTIYNSIEVLEGLEQGQKVTAGEEIGVISTNNRQEYKDGAHLHFEVMEKGKNIDPFKYLDIDGK